MSTSDQGSTLPCSAPILRPLNAAQMGLVQDGQVVAPYVPDVHAEAAGLDYAAQQGLTVTKQQATRIMCPECADAIEQAGGIVAGKSGVLPTK
jgi:hypothetical protein